MHAAGIAHLDVKPENVLVKPQCSGTPDGMLLDERDVRLGDFGMSQSVDGSGKAAGWYAFTPPPPPPPPGLLSPSSIIVP